MKVSVVMPVYNGQDTIAAAVESALAQRCEDGFEVIVVNDGSTDGTRAVLEKFGARIRVIDQANAGPALARNTGIAAAAGEYIALLDADDTWTQDKLKKTVEVLDKNPASVAAFSNVMQVDDRGMEVSLYVAPEFQHSPTLDEMLEWPWSILPSAIVIRRETLEAIGGFPEDFKAEQYGGEDTFIFLLVRERGEILYVPETLTRRRLRAAPEHYVNRLRSGSLDIHTAQQFSEFERRFDGTKICAQLAREHFGARARKFETWAADSIASDLVGVGLMAMYNGNRGFARRCYRASIRYRPLMLKTYVRFAWAILPMKLSERISRMLAPGLRRSLSGPPVTALQDRPQ